MSTRTLKIEGMSCGHCVMSVRKQLEKVSTVKEVLIGSATVVIDEATTKTEDLKNAVAEAGYQVIEIA